MVAQRHEALRTRVVERDGTPRLHVDEPYGVRLDVVEIDGMPAELVESEIRRHADEFIREELDISIGPLFAARLLRFSARESVLIYALEHMISDAASLAILFRELWALYHHGSKKWPDTLRPVPLQLSDYAAWQYSTGARFHAEEERFWKARLSGAPTLKLPGGSGWRKIEGANSEVLERSLEAEISSQLRCIAQRERVLFPLTVCTLYIAVMLRWCMQEESVLTFVSNARYRPEFRGVIGCLSSMLNLRVQLRPRDTFLALLHRVSDEFHSALRHHDFDRVPDILPELAHQSTDLLFNWLPAPQEKGPLLLENHGTQGDCLLVQPPEIHATTSVGFALLFFDTRETIRVKLYYLPQLFPHPVVHRFFSNLQLFAEQLTRDIQSIIPQYV